MDKGAHFFWTDLQVHLPRDKQWTGKECTSGADRKAYATSLIQACRTKKPDAIAITDHHDLLFAKYIRQAAEEERGTDGKPLPAEKQIIVFPGIELTLAVPCQALLIFDSDFPDDMFSLALNALAIAPSLDTDAKTIDTKRLEHITTQPMLTQELDKHAFLRNRYIILPNVSEGAVKVAKRPAALRCAPSGDRAALCGHVRGVGTKGVSKHRWRVSTPLRGVERRADVASRHLDRRSIATIGSDQGAGDNSKRPGNSPQQSR